MVMIDVKKQEIEALDALFNDSKCSVAMGYVLGSLRIRIQESILQEQEKNMRAKFAPKKKIEEMVKD